MSKKDNLLVHKYPEVAAQFHPTKNGDLKVEELSSGSNKNVWWTCKNGHEFDMLVYRKVLNENSCPCCSGRRICEDNCLATLYPEIAKEWHPTKNGNLTPYDVTAGSGKEVWWVCGKSDEHVWEAIVTDRRKHGCPYCSGRFATSENNLSVTHPYLLKEWDYEKNGELKPEDFKPRSNKKVWWKCSSNHQHTWLDSIDHRTTNNAQCSHCDKANKTSFPEQTIYYYIKKVFPDALNKFNHHKLSKKSEFDVFIPSENIAIEYDGRYHEDNKSVKRDEIKNRICLDNEIILIRIRIENLPLIKNYDSIVLFHDSKSLKSLQECIEKIFEIIKSYNKNVNTPKLNIENDKFKIYDMIDKNKIEDSLGYTRKDLLKEWDFEKNKGLDVNSVKTASNIKVWWICNKGHSYDMVIANRSFRKQGCPYCSGKRVCLDNSLGYNHEELLKEWNYNKNIKITPFDITSCSGKMVWWICEKGHEWKAPVARRTSTKSKCPFCDGRMASKDNNLLIKFPNIASEWHKTKNGDLKPEQLTCRSSRKVWWQCEKGHEWEVQVANRTAVNLDGLTNCPYCSGKLPTKENNLAILFPNVASEWHPYKNENLTPYDILPYSTKKVWWVKGNKEWEARVSGRVVSFLKKKNK